jgi:hypothetical protein
MAISIFFYCEIYIFSEGVFLNKICGPGGYNIAPCPINCAWWAESNDTTLDFLAPPEDPHPTLPVIDQKITCDNINYFHDSFSDDLFYSVFQRSHTEIIFILWFDFKRNTVKTGNFQYGYGKLSIIVNYLCRIKAFLIDLYAGFRKVVRARVG